MGTLQCEAIAINKNPYRGLQFEGSDEPDKIPDWFKYCIFIMDFDHFANEFVQSLAPSDYAILSKLSGETERWIKVQNVRLYNDTRKLCARRSTLDVVTFARETERIAAESNNRSANRVKKVVETLTESGQRIVKEILETRVTPDLTFPKSDLVEFALADPENARAALDDMCHDLAQGEPPKEN